MILDEKIAELFLIHNFDTQIIAASVRHPDHVTRVAMAGAHIATIPYSVIEQLANHPLTNHGIEKFAADWEKILRTKKLPINSMKAPLATIN